MRKAWKCSSCGHRQVITDDNVSTQEARTHNDESKHGRVSFKILTIACLNPDCRELEVSLQIKRGDLQKTGDYRPTDIIFQKRLMPDAGVKSHQDCVPPEIWDDYYEAARIVDVSPKAAAALARRCLRACVRDFAGVSKASLSEEIDALSKMVASGSAPAGISAESVEAIEDVKAVGKIGAHLKHDPNMIVEVHPKEARLLLEIVELLFADWYEARHRRLQQVARLKSVVDAKDEADERQLAANAA